MLFPDCSTVIWRAPRLVVGAPRLLVGTPRIVVGAPRLLVGTPRLVVGAPRLLVGTPRLVVGAPRCSQTCCRRSQVLPGAPGGHCIGPVNSGIWPPWDSGPTTLRHSHRLPVTKIHFADVHTSFRYDHHLLFHTTKLQIHNHLTQVRADPNQADCQALCQIPHFSAHSKNANPT